MMLAPTNKLKGFGFIDVQGASDDTEEEEVIEDEDV